MLSGQQINDLYTYGSEIQLTATTDGDYEFAGWEGDVSSTDNPITITIESDMSIEATFDELCTDPEECISTQFYASVIVGSFVFNASINFQNRLPDEVSLIRVVVSRENGTISAQSDVNESINPGQVRSFQASFLPQPTAEQFVNYTAEFQYEYNGTSYSITRNGQIISF